MERGLLLKVKNRESEMGICRYLITDVPYVNFLDTHCICVHKYKNTAYLF